MTNENETVLALERALHERAEALAAQFREQAKTAQERIRWESEERLRIREERETLSAKNQAERVFRRRVQAAELRLQADLDRARWRHITDLVSELREQLTHVRNDREGYLQLLENLLARGAQAIEQDQLVVYLNPADRDLLLNRLAEFEAAAGKKLELSAESAAITGGMILSDNDGRIRLDNSLEGRVERHLEKIQQILLEHLFGDLRIERLQHET